MLVRSVRRLAPRALLLAALSIALHGAVAPGGAEAQTTAPSQPQTQAQIRAQTQTQSQTGGVVVVYLVRHAERATDHPTDPGLTEQGLARAQLLARTLGEAGIEHVHSSPLRRARLTAEPLAARIGVPVQDYLPGDLQTLADRIRETPGRHFVSGHSNTTPALVALLGGEPGHPYDEATEYDRLYILTVAPGPAGGSVTTTLLRYGDPAGR